MWIKISKIFLDLYYFYFSGIENESTVTFSLEQRGDLLKKNKSNINLRKFFFDKDSLMDKENSEILKEEESLNDNVLNSERKVVRVINSYNFKQRLMEFMNKNWFNGIIFWLGVYITSNVIFN